MKRTIRTLTAAAMAGAIAIPVTPAADAQTNVDPTEVATKIIEARFPAVIVTPNGTYYELIDGEYKEAAAAPATSRSKSARTVTPALLVLLLLHWGVCAVRFGSWELSQSGAR